LELIDHSGVSYPVGDVQALTRTLQWLVDDTKIVAERGERAREVIKRLYSWDSVVVRMETAYKNIL
jgi:glycosyltransferase involved in cell wall biosynthesis